MRWNGKRGGRRGESIIFMALSPLPGSFLSPWALDYVQTQQKSKKTPYKRSDLEFGVLSHWSYQGNERQEKLAQDVRCQSCWVQVMLGTTKLCLDIFFLECSMPLNPNAHSLRSCVF